MTKKMGWIIFAFGLTVLIAPIAIAIYFGGDVPASLYAIPWVSIGLIVWGLRLIRRKSENW